MPCTGIIQRMLDARDLPAANPSGLSAETAALVAQLLQRLQDQEQQLAEHGCVLAQRDQAQAERDALLQRKDREIALREAKIEKITFELARLKRWKFGAKSEAMNAEAPLVRGDAGGGRGQSEGAIGRVAARPARCSQDAEGTASQAAPPSAARAPGAYPAA